MLSFILLMQSIHNVEFAIRTLPFRGIKYACMLHRYHTVSLQNLFTFSNRNWGSMNSRTWCFSKACSPALWKSPFHFVFLPMRLRRALHTSGTVHCLSFYDWLDSFSTVSSTVVHMVTCQNFLLH